MTDTLLFALLLAVVGGAVPVAHDHGVAAFGTVPTLFGLVGGTCAYVLLDGDASREHESDHGKGLGRDEE